MMIINKVRTKFFDVIEITSIRFFKPAIVISIEPQNPSTAPDGRLSRTKWSMDAGLQLNENISNDTLFRNVILSDILLYVEILA